MKITVGKIIHDMKNSDRSGVSDSGITCNCGVVYAKLYTRSGVQRVVYAEGCTE